MSEPVRILLRLVGLVLFAGSLLAVVTVVALGPDEVGRQMGESCRHTKIGPSQPCTWQDVLGVLQALPFVTLVGAVLLLVMRRQADDPSPSRPSSRLQVLGALAVVVLVVFNFVGVFAYRAGYTIVTTTEVTKEIVRDAPDQRVTARSPGAVR